jgi:hypothetical protein
VIVFLWLQVREFQCFNFVFELSCIELVALVDHWNQFRSPAVLIAVDVIVQRAMYELSDKFMKKSVTDESSNDRELNKSNHSKNNSFSASIAESQENIDNCISILSTVAIPLCMKLQNNLWNLAFLDPVNSTYAKMHTLNRQLQELLSWTSLVEQAPIPDSFMEMLRFQVEEGVKLTTPRSMAALEIFDSILLSCINEGNTVVNLNALNPTSIDFISNVENKMIFILKKQLSEEIAVKRCGSNVMATSFFETGIELDYDILNILPKPSSENQASPPSVGSAANKEEEEQSIKELESVVQVELLYEAALKHVKACVKDFTVGVNEFIKYMENPTPVDPMNAMMNNNMNSLNNSNHGVDRGGGGGAGGVGIATPAAERPPMHYLKNLTNLVVLDAEEIHNLGEKCLMGILERKNERITNHYPILQLVLNKIENYYEESERDEKAKTSNLRKIIKSLEKTFKDQSNNLSGHGNNNNQNNVFQNVKSITNRSRFIILKFQSYDARNRQPINFTLSLESPLPLQGTELLRNILKYDSTGKLKLFLNTIKKFVKSHRIYDPINGFLSIFTWYVMGIHMLIKFKYLFYVHGKSFLDSNYSDGNFPQMNLEQKNFQYMCLTQLSRTSIMELLDKFFRYYVEEFDTFKNIVSIRNVYHPVDCSPLPLMTKTVWKKNPVLWRLSVEDPCDPVNVNPPNVGSVTGSKNAFDLGSSLSRPGQLTVRKNPLFLFVFYHLNYFSPLDL